MHINITLGDPAGIGPEVTFKALRSIKTHPGIVLFMHPKNEAYIDLHEEFPPYMGSIKAGEIKTVFVAESLKPNSEPNHPINAQIAYEALLSAIENCKQTSASLVTAPISKAGFLAANIPYTGHTTLLQSSFNTPNASMAFHSKDLNVILSTIHIPLMSVEKTLTTELLTSTIKNAIAFARTLGIKKPRIGVAGLNPHASENGQFGSFESSIITPLINSLSMPEASVSGPVSPDVIFRQAVEKQWDVVVALYHDQGLIPIKLLAFDSAVNVTVGLPICRTSPDHGTAYDIAGKNIANPTAMAAAIEYAIKYGQ